jgi:radical SAM superfamily enzyme YgiQ (UPF0313 family)
MMSRCAGQRQQEHATIEEVLVLGESVLLVRLPSPPRLNVFRDWAGGYGTALPTKRTTAGHDPGFFEVPSLQTLYVARVLQLIGIPLRYENLQMREQFDLDGYVADLRADPPKVILASVNLPSLDHDLEMLAALRKASGARIVLFGPVVKLFRERVLREGIADYVVLEDDERTTAYVVQSLIDGDAAPCGVYYLEGNGVGTRAPEHRMTDLNFVDIPAYNLLDFRYYESTYPFDKRLRYMTVATSRGCPYPCTYCPYPAGFGRKVLYRSPELVLSDIETLIEQYGVQFVVFRDQSLTLNRAHCEAIFHGMIERKLNVIWLCETRFDLVDRDLLELMYASGCREINYGLESGDQALFASMAKAGNQQGLEQCGRIIQQTKEAGIRCHTHLLLGLPDDSRRSVRKTIRFLRKYRPDSVQVAIYIPYPGTPLGDKIRASGKIPLDRFEDYTGFKAVVPTKDMSVEQLDEMRLHIHNVWNRPFLTRAVDRLKRMFTSSLARARTPRPTP